ncbi:hypothetical protein JQ604_27495 [Bradyrhizobium jicamae]|uniref:hypothetical protein n=1 Tax=Bradyrhizobium jicamae TaxID=280332 RepID=UPI001BA8495E|nr:hypothetical protein [Bradyrhizobium jicamae]MBR0755934.1 hypothetical protein [Bradyrhizobium jicamae]
MDALEAWGISRLDRTPETIKPALLHSGVYVFLISFACLFYLCNGALLLGHYDLGWHLAAGDLIRERRAIPVQDPWAFTLGDKRWFNLSWLWDVIASVIYQHAGFAGLVLFTVACGAVIVGYLTSICLRAGASGIATCIAVFIACVLYPAFEAAPNMYLAASPNTPTMLFAVMFTAECLRRTRWFLLPPAMVLWANLHGGFVIGFLIVGLFGAVALLRRDWADVRTHALTGIGCALAILVNPLGWHIYAGVTATLGHFVQANIGEWLSYYENIRLPGSIPGMIVIAVFVAFELRFGRATRVPLEARLLAWLFLLLGLYQFRYMAFFFLFSALPLALHIDRLLSRDAPASKIQGALLAAGIMGACALPLTFVLVRPSLALPDMLTEQDGRYLESHLAGARVLNHWNVGGYQIFRTHGTVPVFVDGRAATAYPDDLLRDYFKLVHMEIDEAAWDGVIAKYNIDAVLWVRAHEQLRRFLIDKRGWTEAYAGPFESVYVRPGRDAGSR